MNMPPGPRMRPISLYSIIESLQRRLERQGLASEVVDVAVCNVLRAAARSTSLA